MTNEEIVRQLKEIDVSLGIIAMEMKRAMPHLEGIALALRDIQHEMKAANDAVKEMRL